MPSRSFSNQNKEKEERDRKEIANKDEQHLKIVNANREERHGKFTSFKGKNENEHELKVAKGNVLVVPTQAIPYYDKYDNATDSSSEYSEVYGFSFPL
ncbi:unnamed protein product [Strongylus vulgaris]|uniref:Uncharacterized protein n=1 Tax=Strongylus vulgaris TaxID=40348 RepID=A0A3P7IKW4_STRVU|nr:unnamed protein product [Strongylus vulgaris]